MPNIKLTERTIERLPAPNPSGKQVLYWDKDLRGFGVLVSGTTSAKTFIAQRRLPDGRQRRVTIEATNALPLDKARSEAETLLHDLRLGNDPKAARRGAATLQKTLDDFLASRKTLREKSRADYRKAIERYLSDWMPLLIREISSDMVERRHAAIQAGIAKREDERPKKIDAENAIHRTGNATANGVMVALRVLWYWAAERDPGMAGLQNPVRRLRQAWFPVERRTRRLTTEQLPVFYAAVDALENRTARDYLLLLLFTGLRRSEAASLRWNDIDLPGKVIHLRAQRTKTGRKLDLPMSDFVHDLIVARRALGRDTEFVFAANGRNGYITEPKFPLAQVMKQTGIHVSAHDLRRTFIGVAEALDMSVYALKGLVNHSAGKDVTAGYLDFTTERLRGPAQRVADRLKQLCRIVEPSGKTLARLQAPPKGVI
jgi:integrase